MVLTRSQMMDLMSHPNILETKYETAAKQTAEVRMANPNVLNEGANGVTIDSNGQVRHNMPNIKR